MLDFGPYLRRPISTLLAIASDPFEEWSRFREQYYAHREKPTPADLYRIDIDWEQCLCRRLFLSSPHGISSEFASLWP
jgi:hypothetical protein